MPDAIRALARNQPIPVRNPNSTRPWQHVLEPLGGYLLLVEALAETQVSQNKPNPYCEAFNFGPMLEANRSVRELIETALQHWPEEWRDLSGIGTLHEAGRLHLQIDKAHHQLGWQPRWPFATTVQRTVGWYQSVHEGVSPMECCMNDLELYGLIADGPSA